MNAKHQTDFSIKQHVKIFVVIA